jgi:hypothetical protein
MPATYQMITFRSVFASPTGEYAGNMSYPAQVRVTMPRLMAKSIAEVTMELPSYVKSLDLTPMASATEVFMDEDGNTVDLDGYGEDFPELAYYRITRPCKGDIALPYAGELTLYLVIRAKHHDTFVAYELTDVKEAV